MAVQEPHPPVQLHPPSQSLRLYDLPCEQAVIGATLEAAWRWEIEREWAEAALAMLEPRDFSTYTHQIIWQAILSVVAQGNPPNLVFVDDELIRSGKHEDTDGPTYLQELGSHYWHERHYISQHARIVRTASLQRQLADAAMRGDMDDITTINQKLSALGINTSGDNFATLDDAINNYFEVMGESHSRGVKTGVPGLDRYTGGFHPGNLVGIAARPGVGKSAFGLSIAYHASIKNDVPGGFLSLEMSTNEIIQRLVAMEKNISTFDARDLTPDTVDGLGQLAGKSLYLRRPGASVGEVMAEAGELVGLGCKYIVIDYLQLMNAGTKSDNRPQELAAITRQLKNFAQQSEVPVILLAQLKRDQQHGGAPRLEDIGDSDSLARDSDIVLFLNPQDAEGAQATIPVELLIAKHRNGPTGSVNMVFVRKTTRFFEASNR